MEAIQLTPSTKSHLLEALQPETSNRFQYLVSQSINRAVHLSEDSDELLARLKEGQEAYSEAIMIVQYELKLTAKGNIHA